MDSTWQIDEAQIKTWGGFLQVHNLVGFDYIIEQEFGKWLLDDPSTRILDHIEDKFHGFFGVPKHRKRSGWESEDMFHEGRHVLKQSII